ncbi:hypothetical protein ACFLRI_03480 [Bacteroidota bacterium]
MFYYYEGTWFLSTSGESYLWSYGYTLIYPIEIGKTIDYRGPDRHLYIDYIGVDTVEAGIMENTVRAKLYYEGNVPDIIFKTYSFAKNAGLIKAEFENGTKIELVDYFINN